VTEVRLDAGPQTLALVCGPGLPEVIYWGARLPLSEDLVALAAASRSDLTGGMLDALPALSLCPEAGRAWQGQPGLTVCEADGTPFAPRFSFDGLDQSENSLTLRSSGDGLTLTHRIEALGDSFVLTTGLTSDRSIRVQWLAAPVLPGPQLADQIIDVSGKWTREFALQRTPWTMGIRLREARSGRSGHEHPPMALFPERGATGTTGCAYALQYGWSGGHRMVAEELPDGRRQIQFGHAGGAETEAGTVFETAPLYAAFSDSGLNGIAVTWQHLYRDHIVQWPEPARPRPVHYNSWEGIYFDHDLPALKTIADKAAAIGAERFVLDDGWFGRRDDDTTSLGDWVIDRRKWPDGLHPLIAHVHALKMTFGLWFEPEMVNPDSDLYRAHPDWALGTVDQILGRHQMVLNLAMPQVRDTLFDRISAILSEYPIDYIKWDHNRLLPVVDAGQTRGAYALFDRLRRAHPEVEIESCASGGGRIDAGILARTHRVWLSDCNDALERLRMQHDAALFIPSCITGSHVGPRHSHTTGRILPMAFRAWVAAQRHMGFEMDLRELTDEETTTLTKVTAWYKANRGWMMGGDILRLDSADPSVTAEIQTAGDGHRFAVFAGQAETSEQVLPRPLRLTGLDANAVYEVRLTNPEDAPKQSRGPNALKSGSLRLSGRSLMSKGLLLPVAWPATMWVIEGQRL
jgi:alpha-galactosidase